MSEQVVDQFVVGSLLGDGYISKLNVFGFNHSSKQRAYFEYKVELLKTNGYKVRVSEESIPKTFIKDHVVQSSIKLNARTTKTHMWRVLRAKWYPNGKKVVPADILLTPVTLAYWYMDDGSANMRSKHTSHVGHRTYAYTCQPYINQIRLYTDGFDKNSQEILEIKLKEIGINGRHYVRPDGHRFLVIAQADSKKRFKDLTFSTISAIPSMCYKIDHPLQSQFERLSEGAPLYMGDAIVRSHEKNNHEKSPEMRGSASNI